MGGGWVVTAEQMTHKDAAPQGGQQGDQHSTIGPKLEPKAQQSVAELPR
jgi:multidrug efflux system outer membrane protein